MMRGVLMMRRRMRMRKRDRMLRMKRIVGRRTRRIRRHGCGIWRQPQAPSMASGAKLVLVSTKWRDIARWARYRSDRQIVALS